MDEATEEEEIKSALAVAANAAHTDIQILNIRESFAKTKQALIKVPENIASTLINAGKVRIGWVICRVRKKTRARQCFRCFEQGHVAKECNGKDRSGICRKCGNPGHKFKECKGQVRCVICQEAGLDELLHYAGSAVCIYNRRRNQQND